MGKARIVSGGEDGQYTVELLHNRDRINAEIETLNARITALEEEVAPLETEREELVAERNAIASEIDQAVDSAAEDEIPDVEALLVELSQVSAQIQSIDVRIAMLQGRILQAKQRRTMLQSIPADPQQSAWCADFTEDLTGEVGTVDLPGEGAVGEFLTWRRVIVRPGYGGAASYAAGRDGQMHFREGQSPEQAFFNAAILPGWQKWMPLHRIGTITAVDKAADTCSLNLQSEDSSAQSLLIDSPDLQYALTNVPVEYMECNAEVFEIGDRVLIEFASRSWSSPKVIGFESSPRPCPEDFAVFLREFRVRVPNDAARIQICSGSDITRDECESGDWGGATIAYSPELEIQGRLADNHLNFMRVVHATGFGSENGAVNGGYVHGVVSGTPVETAEGLAYPQVALDYYFNNYRGCYLVQGSVYSMCMSASSFNLIWSPVLSINDITNFEAAGTTYSPVGFMYVENPPQSTGQQNISIAIGFEPV